MRTNHTKTERVRELGPEEAALVFADPVAYLREHGLEARLVETAPYPLADAA
jgi:hypothetical protein